GRMLAEVGGAYSALIDELPLVPIAGEAHYDAAIAGVERLLSSHKELGADESRYLDALTMLVERYEDDRHPLDEVRGVALLVHLIEANGLKQKELAPLLGGESVVSS